jgi:Iap family predicted aminopeptidase
MQVQRAHNDTKRIKLADTAPACLCRRHLRFAVIAADHGSFRRAAERLMIRQSTLSRSWNANKILRTSTAALETTIKFAQVNYYVKHSFSKDAAPELIAEIAANNDIVLTAIGDRGSCCSCCIRDSVALEKLGIPSAAIITTEFERETELRYNHTRFHSVLHSD